MKYLLILLSLMNFSAFAGDFKLTHGGVYNLDMPTVAHSYDGKARDVSKFYKPSNEQFYLGGQYTLDSKRTKITSTYNNGFNSDKIDIQPSLYVGIKHVEPISERFFITYNAGRTFGGDTKHSPCIAELGKKGSGVDGQFYCGNLTAWSDFDQKGSQDGENYNVGIRFTFTF